MTLNSDQQAALDTFKDFLLDDDNDVMVIEGHAGVGKTFLIDEVLKQFNKQAALSGLVMGTSYPMASVLTATTNKAAKVLGDRTGQPAKTIHSLLELKPRKDYETGKIRLFRKAGLQNLTNLLLIIDEASFIDRDTLLAIHSYVEKSKIVFIGDPFQLAPVGYRKSPVFGGNFLTAKLNTLVRNPGPIGSLAGEFREVLNGNDWPTIKPNGKEILHVDGPTFQQMIEDCYTAAFSPAAKLLDAVADDNDLRVLAWSNERVNEYNDFIREHLGFTGSASIGERLVVNEFMPRAKLRTDQHIKITSLSPIDVFKGIEGRWAFHNQGKDPIFIPNFKAEVQLAMTKAKRHKDWRHFYHLKEDIADLRPLYASTVHKSQGSTYGTVFIDLNDIGRCNDPETVARLLYVAISRASDRVVFYGELPDKYKNMVELNT